MISHDCRWKMASCYQPFSRLCLSWTFTEHLGWSSTNLSLTNFGRIWWNESLSSQRAKKQTGDSWLGFDVECSDVFCWGKSPDAAVLLCCVFLVNRYGKLEELLEKSFPLVKMPSIQPVVMQVLKHLPKASAQDPHCGSCCLLSPLPPQ